MYKLLLIDDTEHYAFQLKNELEQLLEPSEVEIDVWVPKGSDNPRDTFNGLINPSTILVITDYDLTSQGQTGLFGASIVDWCQSLAIPVGDFSRGQASNLPSEPNLFELRVPTSGGKSALFIASVFKGFLSLRKQLEGRPDLLSKRRPAGVLSAVLGVPELESQFALYGSRLTSSNGALLDKILKFTPIEVEPSTEEKQTLVAYIIGHLLLNSILKFPGPILSIEGLGAYLATSEHDEISILFDAARYSGPFNELGPFFWLSKVDTLLDLWGEGLQAEFEYESSGELNRSIIENQIKRPLSRNACSRCHGKNGGFLCPFTKRAICQLPTCSVSSSSWIPAGARICRIERDFYDELAPILGM